MSLFVFDFDGVLFDTARECLEVAYATARRRDPASWPSQTPPHEVASAFLRHRHVVGPPWQYAVLLDCIAGDHLPATTTEFIALAATRERELATFTDEYFATRTELAQDVPRWCAAISPYASVLAAYGRLHERGVACVLSTRDDRSIRAIFKHFAGYEPRLLPRAGSKHKWQLLVDAAREAALAPPAVWFLDDYASHAIPAKQHEFAAHLALWGYLGAEDIHNARAAGVGCIDPSELDAALARHEERP